jgi:hypothetical protein
MFIENILAFGLQPSAGGQHMQGTEVCITCIIENKQLDKAN